MLLKDLYHWALMNLTASLGRRATPGKTAVLLLVTFLLLSAAPIYAQSTPVDATVDRSTLSTDETLTLSVTVLNAGASQPSLPVLDGFRVLGSSSTRQTSIVNGVVASEATYQYALQPTRSGELTIPPISVTADGQTYTTEPITVQVTQGTTPSQPTPPAEGSLSETASSDSFFVEAEVDNPEPYLGQQITYVLRFYQAESFFGQPSYDAPDFAGFWSLQELQQSQYFEDRADRTFRVTELRTILFPTAVGQRTIESAAFRLPGLILRAGATLRTRPVPVTVRPMPDPIPDDFSGAVGQYSMNAIIEPTTVAVNEPISLKVTIEGAGNIENIPDPEVVVPEGWRTFEGTSSVTTRIENGRVSGTRIFEQLLVPTTPDEATIPPINYSYFDPETETYSTLHTEPISVDVSSGASNAPVATLPGVNQEAVELIESDIRHIKPAPPSLETAPSRLTESPVYWLLWLLPPSLIAGDWFLQRRARYRASNPALVRRAQALRTARRVLARASQQQLEPHAAVDQALSGYLSDKLSRPVGGLTQTALVELLRREGVSDNLVTKISDLLATTEINRYAPSGSNGQGPRDIIAETEQVLAELEKVL